MADNALEFLHKQGVLEEVMLHCGGLYGVLPLRACCRSGRMLIPAPEHFGDEEDMLLWAARRGDMLACRFAIDHGACRYFAMAKAALKKGQAAVFTTFCAPVLGNTITRLKNMLFCYALGSGSRAAVNSVLHWLESVGFSVSSLLFFMTYNYNYVAKHGFELSLELYDRYRGLFDESCALPAAYFRIQLSAYKYGLTGNEDLLVPNSDMFPALFGASVAARADVCDKIFSASSFFDSNTSRYMVRYNSPELCRVWLKYCHPTSCDMERIYSAATHCGCTALRDYIGARIRVATGTEPIGVALSRPSIYFCNTQRSNFMSEKKMAKYGRSPHCKYCDVYRCLGKEDYFGCKAALDSGFNPHAMIKMMDLSGKLSTSILKLVCSRLRRGLSREESQWMTSKIAANIAICERHAFVKKIRRIPLMSYLQKHRSTAWKIYRTRAHW